MSAPTSPIPEPLGNPICLGPVEVWQIGQDVYGVLAPALIDPDGLPAGRAHVCTRAAWDSEPALRSQFGSVALHLVAAQTLPPGFAWPIFAPAYPRTRRHFNQPSDNTGQPFTEASDPPRQPVKPPIDDREISAFYRVLTPSRQAAHPFHQRLPPALWRVRHGQSMGWLRELPDDLRQPRRPPIETGG